MTTMRRVAAASLLCGAVMVLAACQSGAPEPPTSSAAVPSAPAAPTPSMTSSAAGNGQLVRAFYELAFVDKKVEEAARQYIGGEYIQHNPGVADGAQAFVEAIGGWLAAEPEHETIIHRVLAEGDLVLVHSEHHAVRGDAGLAVMDIFRVQGGEIVEHWDAIQPVLTPSASGHTMFDGPQTTASAVSEADRERNRRAALAFLDLAFNQADAQKAVDEHLGAEYVQHNPGVADGGAAFVAAFAGAQPRESAARMLFPRTIAEGDMVVVQTFSPKQDGSGDGSIDIFRFDAAGKIVEHWDVIQQYPALTAGGRTTWDDRR